VDYEALKSELQAISDLAATVPAPFRERCFEILLQHLLAGVASPSKPAAGETDHTPPSPAVPPGGTKIPTPAQVRVFMQKTNVTESDLCRIFLFEDGELHFVKEPATQKVAQGQIEWALLIALKNGILTNSLSVDPEDVRSICQEKGFYDRANFAAIFKRPNNLALFKGPLEPQGSAQMLSNEGQEALGRLVKSLAGGGE